MKKILLFFVFAVSVLGQAKDPYKIIDALKEKLNAVDNYSADVSINIDVNFLQMPDSKAKVYFKKPDKFRIVSDGFAMLPKQGLNFSPAKFFNEDFDAIYLRQDTLLNKDVDIIKVIPRSDTSEIILSTIWIDYKNNVLLKVEANTKETGTFGMEFVYKNALRYGLPDEVHFSFNIKGVRIPNMNPQNVEDKKEMMRGKTVEGVVTIKYSDYVINKGIDDKVFEEKN